MITPDRSFSMRLKLARKAKDMNMSDVARHLTEMGHRITPQAVQKWENPTDTKIILPRTAKLRALSQLLDVRFEWLAFGSGEMRGDTPARPRLTLVSQQIEERRTLTEAWRSALAISLPEDIKVTADQVVQVGAWRSRFDFVLAHHVVEMAILPDSAGSRHGSISMAYARTLWRLALVGKLTGKHVVFLVGQVHQLAPEAERQFSRLVWEAQAFDIQVTTVTGPEGAARALKALAQDETPVSEEPFFWDDEDE